MKANLDLETILQRAPRPEPPEHLFPALESQITLALASRTDPSAFWQCWRRLWIPLAGLAGAAVIIVILATLFSAGTSRSFANTLRLLTQVKSFHLVERNRDEPERALVVTEYWFQQDPNKA